MKQTETTTIRQLTAKERQRQSGMAMLLTLGFLCVMLMLVLSLAMVSRGERQAAAAGTDAVRSRLLAQSALGEAMARITHDFRGVTFPADEFHHPATSSAASSPWATCRWKRQG